MHSFALRVMRARLLSFLDGLILFPFATNACKERVLIVRLDAIGDFVLWLDAANALVSRYQEQGYFVVLLGNNAWASWAREMGIADEVWGVNVPRFSKQLLYRWKWLIRIRKAGFKIVIQPNFSRALIEGDSVVRASGANERIGSIADESNITQREKQQSNRWYTRIIPAVPTQLMELERNAEFMRGLGFSDFRARLPSIPPVLSKRPTILSRQQAYAVLFIGASWDGKEWPIEKFEIISRRLIENGLNVVLAGGPADRYRASVLFKAFSGEIIDLVGNTSLGELAEVLRGAKVVIANDTGAVHIGVAVDAPVVCILGGGHYGRFLPYEIEASDDNRELPIVVTELMPCFGCNWQCKYPRQKGDAVKCIYEISVEKVWVAVEMALTRHSGMDVGEKYARV